MDDRSPTDAGHRRRAARVLRGIANHLWPALGSVALMFGFPTPPHFFTQLTQRPEAEPPEEAGWTYRPGAALSAAELAVWQSLTAVPDEPGQY